ncbi:MAG: KH domain-containing protein [Bacilli bacterium]|nr:KH domain-containing protein [Bacilli bacterium]
MLKTYKYEGKNAGECLNKCLDELKVTEEDITFLENVTEAKLFKARKTEIDVVLKQDIKSAIKEFLKEICKKMNIEANFEITEKESGYNIIIISESDNSILIGKDGRTLNALQLLLKQYINNGNKFNIRVNVDVSNYKSRKMKNIEYEVKRAAKEVISTKIEVKLDPMNSYERRLVHTIIGEFPELETESYGEGLERHVVIRYKKG